MLALGMAALVVGIGTVPLRLDQPATSPRTLYRIGRKAHPPRVYRATPILDTLVVLPRSGDHGRHSELQIANLSFAVEGRRRAHGERVGSRGWKGLRGERAPDWRDAKELAFAAAVDWSRDGGGWRLGAGINRMALATTRLSGGRTGAQVKVAAVDYIADAGWSIGGGWRATSATGPRCAADRLAAMALGAPRLASGGFLEGTMALADRSTLRIEGSSVRLAENDARLVGDTTDRRITFSLRRTL